MPQYANDPPPTLSVGKSQGGLEDNGLTYNQAGITYNQAGVTYGGFYGFSDVPARISLIPQVSPLISVITPEMRVSFIRPDQPINMQIREVPEPSTHQGGNAFGPGFFLYIPQ
jgi:hypothetical protein